MYAPCSDWYDLFHGRYNLVKTGVNMKTFNDGYHIIHHSNSKLHWYGCSPYLPTICDSFKSIRCACEIYYLKISDENILLNGIRDARSVLYTFSNHVLGSILESHIAS